MLQIVGYHVKPTSHKPRHAAGAASAAGEETRASQATITVAKQARLAARSWCALHAWDLTVVPSPPQPQPRQANGQLV